MPNDFLVLNVLSISVLLSIAAALSFTVGGVFMQLSEGLSKALPSLMVYVMFLAGASLQTMATRYSGMGLTYILILGMEAVLAVLFSVLLFKEGYSFLNVAGMVLVTVGVVFLQTGNS